MNMLYFATRLRVLGKLIKRLMNTYSIEGEPRLVALSEIAMQLREIASDMDEEIKTARTSAKLQKAQRNGK